MAINMLKIKESRLEEIWVRSDALELQMDVIQEIMVDPELNLETDRPKIDSLLAEKEGDYTLARGLLRTTSSLSTAYVVLLEELKAVTEVRRAMELDVLQEKAKTREVCLGDLELEIEETEFSLKLKREDYGENPSKLNRRAVKMLEDQLRMLIGLKNALLGNQ